jgi:NitT/TauT family transport system substrate-binding protein
MDLQAAWREVTGLETSYPQAGLLVKNEVADAYPEVLAAMQETLAENVTYANENPEETGALMEALETGMQAPLIAASMPRNNLEHREAGEVQEALMAYYEVLYDFNPASIGGSLPDEGLFQ